MVGGMYDELYGIVSGDGMSFDSKMMLFRKRLHYFDSELKSMTSAADTLPQLQSEIKLLKHNLDKQNGFYESSLKRLSETETLAGELRIKVNDLESELSIAKSQRDYCKDALRDRGAEISKLLNDANLMVSGFSEANAARDAKDKEAQNSSEKALRGVNDKLAETHSKMLALDKELQVNGRELNGVNALFKDVIGFAKQFCRKQCNRAGRCEQTRCNMFYLLKTLGASPDPPPNNQKY